MVDESKLLVGGYLAVNNKLKIIHPTLREIIDFGEDRYFNAINLFTLKPYDLMVQLDDMGIDYIELSNYDLFILLWQSQQYQDGLNWLMNDIFDFKLYKDNVNNMYLLYDENKDVKIDIVTYALISEFIKKINMVSDKTQFNPANKGARKFIIDNERRKQKRNQKKKEQYESQLSNLISALVWGNTSGINYNNVLDLYAYQFFNGISRLQKVKEYNNLMNGYYTGTIDLKNTSQEEINWLSKLN